MKFTLEGDADEIKNFMKDFVLRETSSIQEAKAEPIATSVTTITEAEPPVETKTVKPVRAAPVKQKTAKTEKEIEHKILGEDEGESRLFLPLNMIPEQTEHDREVMNLLVDYPDSTASELSQHIGVNRQKLTIILSGLLKSNLVHYRTDEKSIIRWSARSVTRSNQRPIPDGLTRKQFVYNTIAAHPGENTTQIGQRTLVSSIDVSAVIDAHMDRLFRREGEGNQVDRYRIFALEPTTA